MSRPGRVLARNGHTYGLYEIQQEPEWNLFEDFGNESALVGSITQDDSQFRIECYWKPEPAARIHNIDARTLEEAAHALLDLAAGEDPRGHVLHVRSDPPEMKRREPTRSGSNHRVGQAKRITTSLTGRTSRGL
jgi:hypothetical protein